jgi:hypothetical protein
VKEEKQDYYYEQYYTAALGHNGVRVYNYRKITYKDIYKGIDWVLYIKDSMLEHEFVVHEGADASIIKLQYSGASSIRVNNAGRLDVATPMGVVYEQKPFSYQLDGHVIETNYNLEHNILSFNVRSYKGELVIDPTLVWGTYYGGSVTEYSYGVAVDRFNDVYVCGVAIAPIT